jgi:hypothetical protein
VEGSGRGQVLSRPLLGETEENHEKPQSSLFPGRDLNPGPPEYEEGEPTTQLRRSVCRS